MGELANYSIETDHIVLLSFKDGRRMRVPTSQLGRYLAPHDIAKITSAIKLRHDFLRQHMPRTLMILVVGGLLALLMTSGRVVAHLWHHPDPSAPSPGRPEIVRSLNSPSPSVTPASSPAVKNAATTAAAPASGPAKSTAGRKVSKKAKTPVGKSTSVAAGPVRAVLDLAAGLIPPLATSTNPSPSPTPEPSASPDPGPTATPDPSSTPPPGQVLGDQIGPDGTIIP